MNGAGPPRGLFPATLFVLLTGSAVFFAGSIAAPGLALRLGLGAGQAAWLTSAVQLGFVAGTLVVVGFDLADRMAPQRLIAVLLILAAAFNAALVIADSFAAALTLRFIIGAVSGPVYPIGMRLLATWYPRLSTRLGILLGAYTLGVGATALLAAAGVAWADAVLWASWSAAMGAIVSVVLLAPGSLLPVRQRLDVVAALRSFRVPAYRRSSLAYFGHMWELFALWGLLPFWLAAAGWSGGLVDLWVGMLYAAGAAGCVMGGIVSARWGSAKVARFALGVSGALCLSSPLIFGAPAWVIAAAIVLWGGAVVADSPMFSALSAEAAPREYVGAALVVQNGIGFLIPVIPLSLIPLLVTWTGSWQWAFLLLAIGPLLGLPMVHRLVREPSAQP